MKNIEVISKKKNQDPLKQQEIMTSVVQALEEEEETYIAFRKQSIKKQEWWAFWPLFNRVDWIIVYNSYFTIN